MTSRYISHQIELKINSFFKAGICVLSGGIHWSIICSSAEYLFVQYRRPSKTVSTFTLGDMSCDRGREKMGLISEISGTHKKLVAINRLPDL